MGGVKIGFFRVGWLFNRSLFQGGLVAFGEGGVALRGLVDFRGRGLLSGRAGCLKDRSFKKGWLLKISYFQG